jgi:hypothetical protein
MATASYGYNAQAVVTRFQGKPRRLRVDKNQGPRSTRLYLTHRVRLRLTPASLPPARELLKPVGGVLANAKSGNRPLCGR